MPDSLAHTRRHSSRFAATGRWSLPVLAIIGIWQNLGLAMVLFLAGLKSIPRDLYDAADIDGCRSKLDLRFSRGHH